MTDNNQKETISCSIEVYTVEQHGCEEWRGLRPYYPRGPYGTYGDTVADLPRLFEQLKADVPDLSKPWTFTVSRLYGADFDSVKICFNYCGKNFYIANDDADDELIAAVEALNTGCRRVPRLDDQFIFAPDGTVFDFDKKEQTLSSLLKKIREEANNG